MVWLVRAICTALVAWALVWLMWQVPSYQQNPLGCDAFGYMRQAQLLRTKGLGGIDTSLTLAPEPQILEAAKQSAGPVEGWAEAIAPHCHHYVARTDKVIIQYPIGTGALMALFPEQSEERTLFIWSAVVATFVFFALLSLSRKIESLVALSAVAVGVAWVISSEQGSPSVWPAIATACIGALCSVAIVRSAGIRTAALGALIIALSASIRLSNALLIVGPIAAMGGRWILRRTKRELVLFVAAGCGFVGGLGPILVANAVNAGSIFSTTYGSGDAAPPVFSLEQIDRAARFYLTNTAPGILIIAAIVLCAIEGVRVRASSALWAVATIVLVANLGVLLYQDYNGALLPHAGSSICHNPARCQLVDSGAQLPHWPASDWLVRRERRAVGHVCVLRLCAVARGGRG